MDTQPRRILIVDDEAGFTRLLKLTLEGTKRYVVKEENDGSRALATARIFRPELVLLDIVMPKMDGGDVARQLSGRPDIEDGEDYFFNGDRFAKGGGCWRDRRVPIHGETGESGGADVDDRADAWAGVGGLLLLRPRGVAHFPLLRPPSGWSQISR